MMNNHGLPIPNTFPTLHLVYATSDLPAPSEKRLAARLAAVEPRTEPNQILARYDIMESHKILIQILFHDHDIRVAGMSTPLPRPITDQTIHVSHWPPQTKMAMRRHQSHLSLVYTGKSPDPIEKMIALYSVAHAFATENLLGIVNEGAWTAHPPADFLSPASIRTYREEIPFNLWVGYVKFFIDEQRFWLATKGHHIFDVPDLAAFVQPGEDPQDMIHHFINVFYHCFEKDVVVTPGDTLEIGATGRFFRFAEVSEYADYLMGPAGTLVMEEIEPGEINPPR